MVKRIIFDLDNTLIPWNEEWWYTVEETFNIYNITYDKDILPIFKKAVNDYLESCRKMDKIEMSKYLSNKINISLPDSFVEVWTDLLGNGILKEDNELISYLDKLYDHYSLTIATNWFYSQQVKKLERLGILNYFDEIDSADNYDRKPYPEMYNHLSAGYKKEEVIVVGDSYQHDIKGAIDLGIHAYFITDSNLYKSSSSYTVISLIYDLDKYL